jgi:hypothetical protein
MTALVPLQCFCILWKKIGPLKEKDGYEPTFFIVLICLFKRKTFLFIYLFFFFFFFSLFENRSAKGMGI